MTDKDGEDHYIAELHIDEESLPVASIEMQHERRVAIFDLLEENEFRPLDSKRGPYTCLLYTSPSPRDATLSRMPSSA